MAKGKYQEWLTPDGLLLLAAWARDGLTLEQIAHNCDISRDTLRVWRDTYPAIDAALKRSKAMVDAEVENALYKAAMGYSYEEITQELRKDPETGELAMVETKRITKQVQPNPVAQIFWLKNRKPAEWRDKREEVQKIEHDENTGVVRIPAVLPEVEPDV